MRKCQTPNGKVSHFNEWCTHLKPYSARLHWKSIRGITREYIKKEGWNE